MFIIIFLSTTANIFLEFFKSFFPISKFRQQVFIDGSYLQINLICHIRPIFLFPRSLWWFESLCLLLSSYHSFSSKFPRYGYLVSSLCWFQRHVFGIGIISSICFQVFIYISFDISDSTLVQDLLKRVFSEKERFGGSRHSTEGKLLRIYGEALSSNSRHFVQMIQVLPSFLFF